MLRNLTILTALIAAPVLAQKDLPDATGKQTTVRVCTGCHGAEMFSALRLNQADWDRKIAAMTTERGGNISDADYATVLKYLSANLKPETKEPK